MSYILDALRRSDQERRLQRGRPLAANASRPHRAHGRNLLLGALAALLLPNAAILAVWALRGAPGPAAPSDGVAQTPIGGAAPPPAQARGGSLLARAAEGEPTRWLDPWEVDPPEQPETAAPPVEPAAAETPPEPAASADTPEPAPAPPATPLPTDAPLLEQLPDATRERLGAVEIGVHVYAEAPSSRFLIFNNARLREGEQLDNGLRLIAITADGAIFRFQQQPFRVVLR